MKKLFAILIAALFMLAAVSCTDNADVKDNNAENNGVNTEQPETPEVPETEEPDAEIPEDNSSDAEKAPVANGELKAVSYEEFKKVIGYSMFPYDIPVKEEANMVHCISGYNGEVELTYFSFVSEENAEAYFDEIQTYFPNQVVMSEEDGDYEICKIEDGEFYYLVVRIDETILYGGSKNGYDALNTWFYGFGYIEKE